MIVSGASFINLAGEVSKAQKTMRQLPQWLSEGVVVEMTGGAPSILTNYAVLRDAGVNVSAVQITDWSGNSIS